MTDPSDKQRRGKDDEGLSDLADAYRKAAPYMGASTQLVASVGLCTYAGWWADRKLGHATPWLLLVGAGVGMFVGFVGFFRTVLGKRKDS
ncbi:MAG TPA: AtpZ/AtpI family protein [Anaeromyxobacteraceae bacterium]